MTKGKGEGCDVGWVERSGHPKGVFNPPFTCELRGGGGTTKSVPTRVRSAREDGFGGRDAFGGQREEPGAHERRQGRTAGWVERRQEWAPAGYLQPTILEPERTQRPRMNWREEIDRHPEVLSGKPMIRGSRISVEIIRERLGDGWTIDQLIEASYPHINQPADSGVHGLRRRSSRAPARPHARVTRRARAKLADNRRSLVAVSRRPGDRTLPMSPSIA